MLLLTHGIWLLLLLVVKFCSQTNCLSTHIYFFLSLIYLLDGNGFFLSNLEHSNLDSGKLQQRMLKKGSPEFYFLLDVMNGGQITGMRRIGSSMRRPPYTHKDQVESCEDQLHTPPKK